MSWNIKSFFKLINNKLIPKKSSWSLVLSYLSGNNGKFLQINENGEIAATSIIQSDYAYQGAIATASDFPILAAVQSGYWYNVTATVTDNDETKTDTGLTFENGDEIYWDGSTWRDYGNVKLTLTNGKYWVGNTLNSPTEKTIAASKNLLSSDADYNLGQAALATGSFWYGVGDVPTTRTLAVSKNLLSTDANGNIGQAALTTDYTWIGVAGVPTEIAITDVLMGEGTLIAGNCTISDAKITASSKCVGVCWMDANHTSVPLTATAGAGTMLFSTGQATDTAKFGYTILT